MGRLLAGIKQHCLVSVAPTWAAVGAYLEASSSYLVGACIGGRWRLLGTQVAPTWKHHHLVSLAPALVAGGAYSGRGGAFLEAGGPALKHHRLVSVAGVHT